MSIKGYVVTGATAITDLIAKGASALWGLLDLPSRMADNMSPESFKQALKDLRDYINNDVIDKIIDQLDSITDNPGGETPDWCVRRGSFPTYFATPSSPIFLIFLFRRHF